MQDNVKNPSHYQIANGVEVIDVREWWLAEIERHQMDVADPSSAYSITDLQTVNRLDRALEYLLRAPGKGGMEDARKAYQYLHRAIYGEWPHCKTCEPDNETAGAVAGQAQRLVMRNPPKLGVVTLCRLMDDCLPEQIDDDRDMQQLIDKLWPALCCEFADNDPARLDLD